MQSTSVAYAQEIIQSSLSPSRKTVFFGGAGVSRASGIPDFRSEDGLYHQKFAYPPEEMLSHHFYESHKKEFFDFYRDRMLSIGYKPNQSHLKLVELERKGLLSAVVTQNIDGLHQEAGSKLVFELHGSTKRNICTSCGFVYDDLWVKAQSGICHCEHCGGEVKPDVVLYEEPLNEQVMAGSIMAISEADTLIVGGTSLVVWPAAGLLNYFKGDRLILINLQSTPQDSFADFIFNVPLEEAFAF